jgi:hypothetical protein
MRREHNRRGHGGLGRHAVKQDLSLKLGNLLVDFFGVSAWCQGYIAMLIIEVVPIGWTGIGVT